MKRFLSATALMLPLAGATQAAPQNEEINLCRLYYDAGNLYLSQGRLDGTEFAIKGLVLFGCKEEARKLENKLKDIRKQREFEDTPPAPTPPAPPGLNDWRIVPTRA